MIISNTINIYHKLKYALIGVLLVSTIFSCKDKNNALYEFKDSENRLKREMRILKKTLNNDLSEWYIGLPIDGKLLISEKGVLNEDKIDVEVRVYSFTDQNGKEYRNLYIFLKKDEMWYLSQICENLILTPEETKCEEPLNSISFYESFFEIFYVEPGIYNWNSSVFLELIDDKLYIISETYIERISERVLKVYFFEPLDGELTIARKETYIDDETNDFAIKSDETIVKLGYKKALTLEEYLKYRNLPKYEKHYYNPNM